MRRSSPHSHTGAGGGDGAQPTVSSSMSEESVESNKADSSTSPTYCRCAVLVDGTGAYQSSDTLLPLVEAKNQAHRKALQFNAPADQKEFRRHQRLVKKAVDKAK